MYTEGKLSSRYEDEPFERRYAAICEELDILPRNWAFGMFGRKFYDLYNLPGVLNVLRLLLGPEVSNIGTPALRTKLPRSVITSFPWHQDSQYLDQATIGKKEKHTGGIFTWSRCGCRWSKRQSKMDVAGLFRAVTSWGLLDGARGADSNVRMEEDVEARGTPVPIPLKPGGALFMSNLCVHTSKVNTTRKSRWSIDFRYFPTPDRADLTDRTVCSRRVRERQSTGRW